MKRHENIEHAATRELAQKFITTHVPAFDDFCGLAAVRGAVLVWSKSELPDLSLPGLHLVEGDIAAPGQVLRDRELDQWVLVGGNVVCARLQTASWFFVAGTLRADVLAGRSGCNNMFYARRVEVGIIVERGHSIVTHDKITCERVYSDHGLVAGSDEEQSFPENDTDAIVQELDLD